MVKELKYLGIGPLNTSHLQILAIGKLDKGKIIFETIQELRLCEVWSFVILATGSRDPVQTSTITAYGPSVIDQCLEQQ